MQQYGQSIPFQSTHPVGGWDVPRRRPPVKAAISIHPPRGGWDLVNARTAAEAVEFQSTHPVGGGTGLHPRRLSAARNFNPPTPWGVGQVVAGMIFSQ